MVETCKCMIGNDLPPAADLESRGCPRGLGIPFVFANVIAGGRSSMAMVFGFRACLGGLSTRCAD